MTIQTLFNYFSGLLLGWPLILYVLGISILCTIAFKGIQFRYFIRAWKLTLFSPSPEPMEKDIKVDMTPLQAFASTLSANIGNGSLAGMATAVYSGGPGAALWAMIIGLFLMAVRFAEVYLSTYFGARLTSKTAIGGPMLYLGNVAGGKILSYFYALFCLFFGFTVGNALQTNSMRLSIVTVWNVQPIVIALILLAFIIYVVSGGASRVANVSEKIAPLKVIIFFITTLFILLYHYQALGSALNLIISSAFQPVAFAGGVIGFTVQQAMRYGISRSIWATESGLGTAAILFGATGSKEPVKIGLMSMLSTFISTLVCFMVALCIVVTGVWHSGLTSTPLTIAAFDTVFGAYGGWIVSFLAVSFGIGVQVAHAYISREAWLFLTKGKFVAVHGFLYCATAFAGALINIHALSLICDLVNAGMLIINLFGIVYLIPMIRKGIADFVLKK